MRNEMEIAETTEERQERLWDELQYRKTMLRVIKRLDNFKVLLQRYDAACESEIMAVDELHIVGRCVRLEAEL